MAHFAEPSEEPEGERVGHSHPLSLFYRAEGSDVDETTNHILSHSHPITEVYHTHDFDFGLAYVIEKRVI